jgi:hypothetical protein
MLADVKTDASYALVHSYGDYTTNLPLDDLRNKQAWIAFRFDGEDLALEHGGPARLLVPHLYLWKSAKWVRSITLMHHDKPGFWESLGYHISGGPMAGAALFEGRVMWRVGMVIALHDETPTARAIALEVPDWPGHVAGQHVDVRLTASDGYWGPSSIRAKIYYSVLYAVLTPHLARLYPFILHSQAYQ